MDLDSLRIKKFCELTGWTEDAVRHLINDGVWVNGREYTKISDRRLVISIKGYESWINKNKPVIPPSFR